MTRIVVRCVGCGRRFDAAIAPLARQIGEYRCTVCKPVTIEDVRADVIAREVQAYPRLHFKKGATLR